MTRAAVYLRVSTDTQAEHGVSLDVQEAECRARAAELGADSVTVYRDDGISGMEWDRPGLQALLSDLPQLDLLVVWAKDRLTRDLRHLLTILDTLATAGTRLVAIRESVETQTAEGILSLQITGALSEYHPRKTAENVKAAMRRIAETGRVPANRPFGYRRNADGALEPDPVQAPIVAELFALAANGDGIQKLAQWLNDKHPTRPRGGEHWRPTSVRWILTNRVYVGEVKWGDLLLPGTHESLVGRAEWDAVQERLSRRVTVRGRTVRHYTPLLRCGQCGSPLSVTSRYARGSRELMYYYCTRRAQYKPEQRHPGARIEEGLFARMLYRHVELLLTSGDLSEAVSDYQRKYGGGASEGPAGGILPEVQERLDDLARMRRINVQSLQRGLITEDDLAGLNAPMMAEEAKLRKRFDDATDAADMASLGELSAQSVPALLDRLKGLPVEDQVGALAVLCPLVELFPKRLRFHHTRDLVPPVDRDVPAYHGPRVVRDLGF